jgi:hypothetical protein
VWLNQLKVAVVQKDLELLARLLDDIPAFEDAKEIEQAQFLIKEATLLVQKLKDDTAASMVQMKKNIDFLNSTKVDKTSKFDITS